MRATWMAVAGLLGLVSSAALAQGRGRGNAGVPPGQAKKAARQEARFEDRERDIARNWYLHERRGGRPDRGDRDEDEDRGKGNAGRGRGNQGGLPPGLQGRELPPGLRDRDRLPPGLERKLVPGYVLDADDRRLVYPAPVVLVRQFPPPQPGFRYLSLGGHIVLVDGGWRVQDVIHLEVDIGN